MRAPGIVLLIFLAAIANAADEESLVRNKESALADAFTKRDKVTLNNLTDPDFKIDWTDYGESVERRMTTTSSRDEWLDDLLRLRPASYKAIISQVLVAHHTQATVFMEEQWTMTVDHRRIEKRFRTIDNWWFREGTWKLMHRSSQTISNRLRLPSSR
jgi:hypothetical protein